MSIFIDRARRGVETRAKNAGRWVWIYALVDPHLLLPRYVGQSRSVFERFNQHNSSTTSYGMGEWRNGLRESPMLLLLKRVRPQHAVAAEEWWIAEGLRRGWPLLNVVRARPERLALLKEKA
jgi:hypothetical protein